MRLASPEIEVNNFTKPELAQSGFEKPRTLGLEKALRAKDADLGHYVTII